jgi:hypothetical protein
MIPSELGCRTNRIRINIMTMHGNSKTRPSGMEMDEFPFSRMRLRKKANRGDTVSTRRDRSSSFSKLACEDGSLLTIFCTSSIAATVLTARQTNFAVPEQFHTSPTQS